MTDRDRVRRLIAKRKEIAATLKAEEPELADRLARVRAFASSVRVSEYHVTNACNLRCKGCWFFQYGFDGASQEDTSLERLRAFVAREAKERHINCALVIGGEPSLVPARIGVFVEHMKYVTVSTNGVRAISRVDFPDVAIAVTLFGGGPLDDDLRGYKPGGRRVTGLFQSALDNYHGDPRATFVYAVTAEGIDHVLPTVERIRDNGNKVTFNYYTAYDAEDPTRRHGEVALLERLLEAKQRFPEAVLSHPYFIETLVRGRAGFGDAFGYDVCPSISVSHPRHAERIANGNPVLPFFNTWGADLETVQECCTSGRCEGCRDSQAVQSWLLVSFDRFLESVADVRTWVELAESYWSQFVWAPFAAPSVPMPHQSGRRLVADTPLDASPSSPRRLPLYGGA